jgi:hypothetical protein
LFYKLKFVWKDFFGWWWGSRRGDDVAKRAGGRFLRRWNKKLIPTLTTGIVIQGNYVEK